MGNPRLLLAPMFLLLPVIRDISDPPFHELKILWIQELKMETDKELQ